jgi:hypothetical protein
LADSAHHRIIGVANRHHTDSTREVEELVAIDIHDDRVMGVGGIDRESGGNSR